jgi:signal transduction histidine kinase
MSREGRGGGDRSSVEALWLETLGALCSRAAHELKGALNGVVVNVEVVRSRSGRPDVTGASLQQYAQSASGQLDAVISMTEAMLSLARPARRPLGVGQAVRDVEALIGTAARADDKRVELQGMVDALGSTSADADVARLVIGAAFVAAVDASPDVVCNATLGTDGAVLCWECQGSEEFPSVDPAVLSLAASEGIDVHRDGPRLSITFPR